MREILFRGKCRNGHWVFGNYSHTTQNNAETNFMSGGLKETHQIVQVKGVWRGYTNEYHRLAWACTPDIYDVDPETIGQYTGLNDKSGMKIFEGDILLLKDSLYKVFWNSAECSFKVLSRASDVITIEEGLDSFSVKSCTIVGNIYDNPELLEVNNV